MSETYTPPALPADLSAKVAALPFSATLTYKATTYKAGPDRWTCTLNREEFTYSKGTGRRVFVRKGWNPDRVTAADYVNGCPRNANAAAAWPDMMRPVAPKVTELLAALISDADCYTNSADVDDFAANYCDVKTEGIQNVLDAYNAYNACARADRLLRRWFTPAELDALREWASQL